MGLGDAIERKLRQGFAPAQLTVVNDSHRHEGHAGWRPDGETHFRVAIVSAAFAGKSRIERQRMVHALLAEELAAGVHALQISARTPEEAAAGS
jgi:BolA protein